MKLGITAVAVVAAVGVGWVAQAGGSGSALFGPAYDSTAVTKNGEPHELVEGTRIRVKFVHEDHDVVRWRSGCNQFGAGVEVTPKRLEVGQIGGTEVGCAKRLHRQDEWIARVFGSDPKWIRQGRRLKLRAGDDAITLRRRA